MSKNLERVIQRAISDAAFRRQLQSNPEAALRGFKLTDSEVAALRSGDAGRLTSLGIDQRMSKTFSFGGDSLASRASIGGDLTSGAGMSNADRDLRLNSDVSGGSAGGVNSAVDSENTSGAATVTPGSASGSTAAFDPGVVGNTTSVGDPMSESGTASVIADPDNPANARGYIGGQAAPTSDALEDQSHAFAASRSADVAGGSTASMIGDPDNPANARGFIGGQAASTSDAIEDQSHAFTASRSADLSTAHASVIGDPDNPANARGYIGEQGGSMATASNIGDPDNPANARGFIGEQAASTSDAIEDQSHAFAATRSADVSSSLAAPIEGSPEEFAFRDQGASTAHASVIGDPDNPAYARGYTGEQGGSMATASNIGDPDNPANARGFIGEQAAAPTSDAIEDQSHVIASRADAFLSEGEVSQYSDPNWSSDQAEDASHAFNPDSATIPDDGGTASVHHEPDVPS